jgi:hypothetical protein
MIPGTAVSRQQRDERSKGLIDRLVAIFRMLWLLRPAIHGDQQQHAGAGQHSG